MQRADSFEKPLMLGKIEGKRSRGRQRMRLLDGITDLTDMGLGGLRALVMDREAWCAVLHGVTKSWTWLSNWTELNWSTINHFIKDGILPFMLQNCACSVTKSWSLCDSMDCRPARLLRPWDFPGRNTGVDCHFLLQGIFPIQGLIPCLLCFLHWQVDSLALSYLRSNTLQNKNDQINFFCHLKII